jgi:hypothetical protein
MAEEYGKEIGKNADEGIKIVTKEGTGTVETQHYTFKWKGGKNIEIFPKGSNDPIG